MRDFVIGVTLNSAPGYLWIGGTTLIVVTVVGIPSKPIGIGLGVAFMLAGVIVARLTNAG